jgi:3-oxoadipate enol-lactonase
MIVSTLRGHFAVEPSGHGGRPVILLHPLALGGAVWGPFAQYLAERQAVVAVDARGHGESTWDGAAFTVDDLAADTAAIIDTMGTGAVDVIGLSMGGSTALILAARRPDLVHRLVLADTTACYGPDRVRQWAERAERAEYTPRDEQLLFQRERWFSKRFRRERPTEVDRISRIFAATGSRAHAAACRALGALDATHLLAGIRADTLVLVGGEDFATPPAMAQDIAKGIPTARLRVLDHTRHLSLIERPDIWPAVAAHLAG